jgi:hypothetical protein
LDGAARYERHFRAPQPVVDAPFEPSLAGQQLTGTLLRLGTLGLLELGLIAAAV